MEVALRWAALCAALAVLAVAASPLMLSLHLLQKAATVERCWRSKAMAL